MTLPAAFQVDEADLSVPAAHHSSQESDDPSQS